MIFKIVIFVSSSGKEIQILVNESIELDHAMSGLSTLGGAFSSLGDQFIDFVSNLLEIS